MRMIIKLTIAGGALLAATSAPAQNTASGSNTADMNTENAAMAAPAAGNAADNGITGSTAAAGTNAEALPAGTTTNSVSTVAMETSSPTEKKSFPWGVIGLLGLLGFIPRTRRRR